MTLTATQIAAGWLPHDGGDCPVPADSNIRIMLRMGWVSDFCIPADWGRWEHAEGSLSRNDIIAYLPEKTDD